MRTKLIAAAFAVLLAFGVVACEEPAEVEGEGGLEGGTEQDDGSLEGEGSGGLEGEGDSGGGLEGEVEGESDSGGMEGEGELEGGSESESSS